MELDLYFNPVDFSRFEQEAWTQKNYSLGHLLQKNQDKLKLEKAELVMFGVEEDRNAVESGASQAPDKIRRHLYNLNRIESRLKVLDLGNIKIGSSVNDTYFALRDVCETLLAQKKTVIILGGSQDLTFGISKCFESGSFSLVSVDPKFDFRKGVKHVSSETYLNLIFEKHKRIMQGFTLLGYQNYFIDSAELDFINQNQWEAKRLGQIRYDMASVEPLLRDADIFSFDLNAVRCIDAPGQSFASPNGLYAEEACQIARYAGLADHLKIAGFFNLLPEKGLIGISEKLMAQIVWHFIEGFHNRIVETPNILADDFNQYIIDMEDLDLPLLFYQSRKTGRWWMEIRDAASEEEGRSFIVPCSEEDYVLASKDEIPDRWWKNIRKFNRN
jgi:arginase family enzyme